MISNFVNFSLTTVGMLIINQQEKFSVSLFFTLIADNLMFIIVVFAAFGALLWMLLELFLQEK